VVQVIFADILNRKKEINVVGLEINPPRAKTLSRADWDLSLKMSAIF